MSWMLIVLVVLSLIAAFLIGWLLEGAVTPKLPATADPPE
jgi:hypothetical protein